MSASLVALRRIDGSNTTTRASRPANWRPSRCPATNRKDWPVRERRRSRQVERRRMPATLKINPFRQNTVAGGAPATTAIIGPTSAANDGAAYVYFSTEDMDAFHMPRASGQVGYQQYLAASPGQSSVTESKNG